MPSSCPALYAASVLSIPTLNELRLHVSPVRDLYLHFLRAQVLDVGDALDSRVAAAEAQVVSCFDILDVRKARTLRALQLFRLGLQVCIIGLGVALVSGVVPSSSSVSTTQPGCIFGCVLGCADESDDGGGGDEGLSLGTLFAYVVGADPLHGLISAIIESIRSFQAAPHSHARARAQRTFTHARMPSSQTWLRSEVSG
eukprot:4647528-Pleurochrysis_carterae.AAC.2